MASHSKEREKDSLRERGLGGHCGNGSCLRNIFNFKELGFIVHKLYREREERGFDFRARDWGQRRRNRNIYRKKRRAI